MGDLLGSFPRSARVRPKCAEKTCVSLWSQSTVSIGRHRQSEGSGCYKWYQSNPATVADYVFSAPRARKHPQITVQRGRCIPNWGECDTSY